MVQLENEHGRFGNDRAYTERLREIWREAGIAGPFYASGGATPQMLEAGSLPGAEAGLDPGARP
jgi:beta-galactosidase